MSPPPPRTQPGPCGKQPVVPSAPLGRSGSCSVLPASSLSPQAAPVVGWGGWLSPPMGAAVHLSEGLPVSCGAALPLLPDTSGVERVCTVIITCPFRSGCTALRLLPVTSGGAEQLAGHWLLTPAAAACSRVPLSPPGLPSFIPTQVSCILVRFMPTPRLGQAEWAGLHCLSSLRSRLHSWQRHLWTSHPHPLG